LQTFETEMLAEEENFGSLARINRELIGKVEALDSPQRVVLDMDSTGKEVVFRADAAFAKPEIYEALEKRGVKYAIRIPANPEETYNSQDLGWRFGLY
jgi:MFS superfamily sulfate permease-like transporter